MSDEIKPCHKHTLSVEMLDSLFHSDSVNGILRWKSRTGPRANPGAIVGSIDSKGKRRVSVFSKTYGVHKIIWAMHYRQWPELQLDHINGNGLDNRIANLRLATPSQNAMNRHLHKNKQLPKGVSRTTSGKGYSARITLNYRIIQLGEFPTIDEAALAYRTAADRLHGEFKRYE